MAKKSDKTGEEISKLADIPDEPFRYSLELVATIATRFVDGETDDNAAAGRAISFLDAVSNVLRVRKEVERNLQATPKYLPFAKGIKFITGKPTESDGIKSFKDFLRLELRRLSSEQPIHEWVKAGLKPLADEKAQADEDSRIEDKLKSYRNTGFDQAELLDFQNFREFLMKNFVRPHLASEKGKMPPKEGKKRGRPSMVKKSSKKFLVRDTKRKK